MTRVNGSALRDCPEPAVQAAVALLASAAQSEDGQVTAATETGMQNALYALRAGNTRPEVIGALETAAARLRLMADAKRDGRCNLYMSQLLRLRRQLAA
jgi:hypothetical protein